MYIRIEFEDVDSAKTKDTQQLFFSVPNGMFLSSSNAYMISSDEIREIMGNSVVFWYLDVDIPNKHYRGVTNCLNELGNYPGVKQIDILPINESYNNFNEKFDNLLTILIKYVYGVK